MRMQRLYNHANPKKPVVNGVVVENTGFKRTQNFSTRMVNEAVQQGWMSISASTLTIHAQEEFVYSIVRAPGTYCCHCREKLSDSKDAIAHIAEHHLGATSPDPENPSGYKQLNAYECLLGKVQHEKFRNLPIGERHKARKVTHG